MIGVKTVLLFNTNWTMGNEIKIEDVTDGVFSAPDELPHFLLDLPLKCHELNSAGRSLSPCLEMSLKNIDIFLAS